jgi:hypothetical protein
MIEAPPDTPALQTARAEMTDIATNKDHKMYAGYHRGDKAVMAHIDELYTKAVPPAPPVPSLTDRPPEPREQDHGATTAEDRVAQTEVETMLQQIMGDDYESEMRDMRIGAGHLFSSPEGAQALTALSALITQLGPLEEVRGIRYLAELGRSIKNHNGGR